MGRQVRSAAEARKGLRVFRPPPEEFELAAP